MIKGIILTGVIIAAGVLSFWWVRKKDYGRSAQYIVGIAAIITLGWNVWINVVPNISMGQQGNNNIAVNVNDNIIDTGNRFHLEGEYIYVDGDLHVHGDVLYKDREERIDKFRTATNEIKTVNEWLVGWGDSSGGRQTYTIEQINKGALGGNIAFNSIVDTNDSLSPEERAAGVVIPLSDERNFVGARENSGNFGKDNVWNGNVIEIEEGKTYLVRLYVHNNSPLGYDAIAKDVSVQFLISNPVHVLKNDMSLVGFDSSNGYYGVSVHGFIDSSNAEPISYWDGVKFVSNKPFELKYVLGTATLENNGIGGTSKYGPYVLSDDIVTEKGVLLGYDILDGNVPGCYKYASYVGIIVMPMFYE